MEHTLMLRIKSLNKKDYGGNIIAVAARHNLEPEARDCDHIDQCKITQNVVLRGAGRAADVAAEAVRLMELAKVKPLRINASLGIEIIFSFRMNLSERVTPGRRQNAGMKVGVNLSSCR